MAGSRHLPELHNVVRALDQVVDVDYYVPGCPPTPKLTKPGGDSAAGEPAAAQRLGHRARHRALRRVSRASRPSRPISASPSSSGPHQVLMDPEQCFLAQGDGLHGAKHAQRVRSRLHQRRHALHRLLRPDLARARPGRSRSVLALRQRRAEGRRRDRQGARRHSRPGRHVLPLRSGEESLRRRVDLPVK